MGSVEVVVLRGHPVLKGNLMFAHDRVQFQDPLPFSILIQGPLGDVDVMSALIGHLTTGIFVPPTKQVVSSLLYVIDFRSLSQPIVPVEVGGRIRFFEGSAGG